MAGHPPDGSWQSASANGQGGPEQVRMAWQPPRAQGQPYEQGRPYEQAPPPWEQAAREAYPPSPSPGSPGGPGFGAGDAQPDQHTLAWELGSAQPQQAMPPGNAQAHHAARTASRFATPRKKGYVASLFDFSFSSFVTPKIIKVLYVLFTIWTALIGITILIVGFKTGGVAGGLFTLIIIEPIFLLLTLGIYRVVLEAFMVIFRIYEETKKIREGNESQAQP
jgi:Domain of unknown function (DUF4282)